MGDLSTPAAQEAQQLLDNTGRWDEHLYDKDDKEIEDYMNNQGEDFNGILYIEYSYKQIGKTEEWLRKQTAKIGDPLTARRELLLQRLHGSSMSPYDQEDIEYIASTQRVIIEKIPILEYYELDVYKKLERKIPYIVGVDCSTGTNSDFNAITILNPYTVEPDAEFQCNFIGETMYEKVIIEIVKMLPRAVICIERNSMGDGIVDHLLHSPISHRLYFDKARDLVDETMKSNETITSMLKKETQKKKFYGVYTERKSREDMFAILNRHVAEFKEKFVTKNIIADLSALIRKPSGKIEAGPGSHDDSIMSYLIALYVYYHGDNLPMFGVIKGAREEDLDNSGMKRPEEINPDLVDKKLIDDAKKIKAKEQMTSQELDWEKMMRDAIKQSQQDTFKLQQSKMLNNTVFDHTPEAAMEEFDDEGSISLDFFSEINGVSQGYGNQNQYNPYANTGRPLF